MEGNGGTVLEQAEECPAFGQPIVADLSALVSLHRLGIVDHAARYFGKILIPSEYAVLALSEQGQYLHHQPAILDRLRGVLAAVETRSIHVKRIAERAELPLLDEHVEGPHYHLRDVASWLHSTGILTDQEYAEATGLLKGAPHPDVTPIAAIIGNGLETRLFTLQTAIACGLFAKLAERVRLYLPPSEIEQVRGQLRAADLMAEIGAGIVTSGTACSLTRDSTKSKLARTANRR